MKSKFVIYAFVAVTVIASLAAVGFNRGFSRPGKHTYNVTGRVVSIDRSENSIRIRHDEIPGYMPAMTMPFEVKEASLLQQLKSGDSVLFRLEVTEEDSWISKIQPQALATPAIDPIASETTADPAERLEPGEVVPDLSLVDQNGKTLTLHSLRGKAVLLTFIYTRCPLPNFCPLLAKNFKELQGRLSKEFPGRFQLVSLTIDPAFDTPEILKAYSIRNGADEESWTFATGKMNQIDLAVSWFGLTREDAGGLINHDLRTALISPEGRLLHVWKSNVWTPYEVQRSVRESLTGSIDVARK